MSNLQIAEFLHLAFLGILQVRVSQNSYVLKGGANLRYFYNSPRYSADIDFDAFDIPRWKLEEKVDEVLSSRALGPTLATKGVGIQEISKPKQTETTQRWKISLNARDRSASVWTRIEFSRREHDKRNDLEQIPPQLTERYALRAPSVRRYLPQVTAEQKVAALAERTEVQARDVFDLDLLLKQFPTALRSGAVSTDQVALAAERVLELPFEAYQNQVVRFLEEDVLEVYDRPEAWNDMRRNVLEKLTALQ